MIEELLRFLENGPIVFKVRLRWFRADLVKLQYLCYLSWDLNVLYIK